VHVDPVDPTITAPAAVSDANPIDNRLQSWIAVQSAKAGGRISAQEAERRCALL